MKSVLAGNAPADGLRIVYFAVEQLVCTQDDLDLWGRDLEALDLPRMDHLFTKWVLPFAPYVHRGTDPWTEDELLHRARNAGYEGWVMKDGNLLNWRKLKRVSTIDCVVTGYEDGNGKYLGLLGALRVGVFPVKQPAPIVEIANVSGMDDAERVRMTDEVIPQLESPDYAGTLVVEIAYQYVGAGGRLRHPRFVRWRDDKSPWECKTDQDTDLQEAWG